MSEQFIHGYALLIGVDENAVARWALPDVARDVSALHGVLAHPQRCAYPPDNVKLLRGSEATRQGILDGLAWLHASIKADVHATAIVYYSGHGWRDESAVPPEFYLIPYDASEIGIRSRALRATDFAQAVAELQPERLLVVLDCCHAGGMGVKGPVPTGYVGIAIPPSLFVRGEKAVGGPGEPKLEGLAMGRGRAVLSSSTGGQPSYMRRDGQMSLFTYCLIEALTGHAQPQEGATEVLVSDVMSYVWRHVPQSARADWNAEQTPDYQVSGNFPIALLLGGKGLSKGQPAPDPLEVAPGREPAHAGPAIDTGGGPVVGRDFTNVGTYIAGDQVIHGDQIGGDKVGGDKVLGPKITVRDVVGSTGTAIGPDAQASLRQGLSGAEIAALFSGIYRQIQARPPDPGVDKAEIAEAVRRIEEEVKKGEDAAPGKVERWLKTLALMAKDIFDVTVACLANPVAGIAEVVKKVAAKARAEAGKG